MKGKRLDRLQERLTVQIAEYLKKAIGTENVAVVIEATSKCRFQRCWGCGVCYRYRELSRAISE